MTSRARCGQLHGGAGAAGAPAHPPGQPRGPVPGTHRQGAAPVIRRMLSVLHARNLEFLRDRGTLHLHHPAAGDGGHRHGLRVRRPGTPAVQGRACWMPRIDRQGLPVPERALRGVRRRAGRNRPPCAASRTSSSTCCWTRTRRSRYWVNTDSPEGLHRREAAAGGRSRGRSAQPVTGKAVRYVDWLFPGHPRHEHDVQLPVRGRLRGAALPQERLPQAPARHPAQRLRVPERPGTLAPGPHPVRDRDPVLRHRRDHRLPQRRQRGAAARWSRS